jgi:hypothetical protein
VMACVSRYFIRVAACMASPEVGCALIALRE